MFKHKLLREKSHTRKFNASNNYRECHFEKYFRAQDRLFSAIFVCDTFLVVLECVLLKHFICKYHGLLAEECPFRILHNAIFFDQFTLRVVNSISSQRLCLNVQHYKFKQLNFAKSICQTAFHHLFVQQVEQAK